MAATNFYGPRSAIPLQQNDFCTADDDYAPQPSAPLLVLPEDLTPGYLNGCEEYIPFMPDETANVSHSILSVSN